MRDRRCRRIDAAHALVHGHGRRSGSRRSRLSAVRTCRCLQAHIAAWMARGRPSARRSRRRGGRRALSRWRSRVGPGRICGRLLLLLLLLRSRSALLRICVLSIRLLLRVLRLLLQLWILAVTLRLRLRLRLLLLLLLLLRCVEIVFVCCLCSHACFFHRSDLSRMLLLPELLPILSEHVV